MALLRDTSGSGTHVDDLMSKLRERLMLNNLVAQSSFGLAAWLSAYPKMDQSSKKLFFLIIHVLMKAERIFQTFKDLIVLFPCIFSFFLIIVWKID